MMSVVPGCENPEQEKYWDIEFEQSFKRLK